jgi:hypothetical protein
MMRRHLASTTLVLLALCAVAAPSKRSAADSYIRASLDQAGQLHIASKDGRDITPKKEPEQVGFDNVAISPDGRSVGWVALYPFPLKLFVYSNGRVQTFTGSGLPIFKWRFRTGGKHVAFEQETLHGAGGIHAEIRNVATGRLIAKYDSPYNRDNQLVPVPSRDLPKWVQELLNAK